MASRLLHPYLAALMRRHDADIGDLVARTIGRTIRTRQVPRTHLLKGRDVQGFAMVPLATPPMILEDDGTWINAVIDMPQAANSLPIILKQCKAIVGSPSWGKRNPFEEHLGPITAQYPRTRHHLVDAGERHEAVRNDAIVDDGLRRAGGQEVYDLFKIGYQVNEAKHVPGTLVDVTMDTIPSAPVPYLFFQESRERPMMMKADVLLDNMFGYAINSPIDVLETAFSDPGLAIQTANGHVDLVSHAHRGAFL